MKAKPTLSEALEWWKTLDGELKKQNTTMFMDNYVLWYDMSEEDIHLLYHRCLNYD